jgi:hypothetical protein
MRQALRLSANAWASEQPTLKHAFATIVLTTLKHALRNPLGRKSTKHAFITRLSMLVRKHDSAPLGIDMG